MHESGLIKRYKDNIMIGIKLGTLITHLIYLERNKENEHKYTNRSHR